MELCGTYVVLRILQLVVAEGGAGDLNGDVSCGGADKLKLKEIIIRLSAGRGP